MTQIILFKCRACDGEILLAPSDVTAVPCPTCRQAMPVRLDDSLLQQNVIRTCAACGHDTLYIQKDFNRNLGLLIVILGVFASIIFFSRTEPGYAMTALVATALIDLAIYSMVGEVTVCYSCHAVYRGFKKNAVHGPFDLKNLEKYGGREPRF